MGCKSFVVESDLGNVTNVLLVYNMCITWGNPCNTTSAFDMKALFLKDAVAMLTEFCGYGWNGFLGVCLQVSRRFLLRERDV